MKYIDADKLRAEIERRMVELAKDKYIDLHDTLCRTKELNLLLSFLDTLEEPVSDCHDLEEAAEEYIKKGKYLPEAFVVRPAFIAGAEWQKRKMMEGAVEGKVFMSFALGHNQMVMADVDLPINTKVRIIILPKEEE